MFRTILSLLMLLCSLPMVAQDYDKMWKSVDDASSKDLPKTALQQLRSIRDLAAQKGHTAQQMRAMSTEVVMLREMTPDSLAPALARMRRAMEREARPVEKAIWQSLLGQWMVGEHSWYAPDDTAQLREGWRLLLLSVEPLEALAQASTAAYLPLFERGSGSRAVYRDDLLSVMLHPILHTYAPREQMPQLAAQRKQLLASALAYYQKAGNRRAALAVERHLLALLPDQEQLARLRELRQRYLDLADNVANYADEAHQLVSQGQRAETAALLREGIVRYGEKAATTLVNDLRNLEQTEARLRLHSPTLADGVFYPGHTYQLAVERKNVQQLEVRFYLLEGTQARDKHFRDLRRSYSVAHLLKRLPNRLVLHLKPTLAQRPAYEQASDSVSFVAPAAGVYVVQLLADGHVMDSELVFVATTARMELTARSLKAQCHHVRYVDAITGRPSANPADSVFLPRDGRYSPYERGPMVREAQNRFVEAKLFTDRAIYRPGQQVEMSAVVYDRKGDDYHVHPDEQVTLVLSDSEGKELTRMEGHTDAMGVVAKRYVLPSYVRPGEFMLQLSSAKGGQASASFRVEYYKRPTFTVAFDPLPKDAKLGDRIRVSGSVRSYTDLPIADAKVDWTVNGAPLWRWWGGGASGDDFAHEGQTTTDDEGRFAFEVQLGTSVENYAAMRCQLAAKVVAPNGETQEQAAHLFLQGNVEPPKPTLELLKMTRGSDAATGELHVTASSFVFVDFISTEQGLVESRTFEVNGEQRIALAWKPEYGDAVTVVAAAVKDGKFYNEQLTLERPRPDKRLVLSWSTFRSHLVSGQQERWTLRVARPDGKPVAANVMARLYDASLDVLAQAPWSFEHIFPRQHPEVSWDYEQTFLPALSGYREVKHLRVPRLDFTTWRPSLFSYYQGRSYGRAGGKRMRGAVPMALMAKRSESIQVASEYAMMEAAAAPTNALAPAAAPAETKVAVPPVALRDNFSETAFFFPQLRTNAEGEATLEFTLPESLTEWRFSAFAHDDQLNTGLLADTIVARKLLMAQAALPRFLREGDRTRIPVEAHNLSETTQQGTLYLTLLDAATERELRTFTHDFRLAQGEKAHAAFDFVAPEGVEQLTVRVVAKAELFSDGEERPLPILSRRVKMTHAVPFTVKPGETLAQKEAAARRRLLAEIEKEAVPTLSADTCKDAREEVARLVPQLLAQAEEGSPLALATALYAVELGRNLSAYHTLGAAEIDARSAELRERLAAERNADGGWSWWKGMDSSPYITTEIVMLLTRIGVLTGRDDLTEMSQQSWPYLDRQLARYVAEMKRHKSTYVSEWVYRLLYIYGVAKRTPSADAAYLHRLVAKDRKGLTMYGKSGTAVILANTRYRAEADLALRSVIEHTVQTEEMGRYFDTDRALGGWASYRIPTQTFAIEAIERLKRPTDRLSGATVAQLVGELRLWLLQSKRTQVWNTSRATTDAIYALLHKTDAANDGLAWGAVRADYTLPYTEAQQKGAGFTLDRQLEMWRGGQWQRVETDGQRVKGLRIGDRVRWVYHITAERDFDHVGLRSVRPACFETRSPLSGFAWGDGLPMYRMVRDAENEYFIEHLSKGKHRFVDEMRVDRAGVYSAGWATVQSVFAPEFVGNTTALEVEVAP